MKQADAQDSSTVALLTLDSAKSDVSPSEDETPTSENAQEAVVAKPMEAKKLRTA